MIAKTSRPMQTHSLHRTQSLRDHVAGRRTRPGLRRGLWVGALAVSLARVRLTEFWERMRKQFGDVYAESVAKDQVLSGLGSRTVNQALADGEDAKVVWRAVCEAFKVPERLR
jgi:Protein of unknown function (DUF3046)